MKGLVIFLLVTLYFDYNATVNANPVAKNSSSEPILYSFILSDQKNARILDSDLPIAFEKGWTNIRLYYPSFLNFTIRKPYSCDVYYNYIEVFQDPLNTILAKFNELYFNKIKIVLFSSGYTCNANTTIFWAYLDVSSDYYYFTKANSKDLALYIQAGFNEVEVPFYVESFYMFDRHSVTFNGKSLLLDVENTDIYKLMINANNNPFLFFLSNSNLSSVYDLGASSVQITSKFFMFHNNSNCDWNLYNLVSYYSTYNMQGSIQLTSLDPSEYNFNFYYANCVNKNMSYRFTLNLNSETKFFNLNQIKALIQEFQKSLNTFRLRLPNPSVMQFNSDPFISLKARNFQSNNDIHDELSFKMYNCENKLRKLTEEFCVQNVLN